MCLKWYRGLTARTHSGLWKLLPGQPRTGDQVTKAVVDGARFAGRGFEAVPRARELAVVLGASAHVTNARGAARAEALGLDLAVDARLALSDAADDNVRHFVREGAPLSADLLLIALALAAAVLRQHRILAEVAVVHACIQEAQAQAAIEWALCGRCRRSGGGAALTDEQQSIGVPALQACDEALGSTVQQLLQHLGGRHVWIGIHHESCASRHVGASHGSATEGCGGGVTPVASRCDAAARGPHVSATAVIAEGGAPVSAVRRADGDGRWNEGGREPARITVGIASCNDHHDTRVHSCIHCVSHGLLSATAAQTHARNRRAGGVRRQPIQCVVAPRPRSTSLIRENLDALHFCGWSNTIRLTGRSAGAMCSVPLPVACAAQVAVALLRGADSHVEGGGGSAAKIVVRMTDAGVEDEDGGLATRS